MRELIFTVQNLKQAYADGAKIEDVLAESRRRAEAGPRNVWLRLLTEKEQQRILQDVRSRAETIVAAGGADALYKTMPLYGVPFGIKDNIDLADVPTTAGCPAYAYTPRHSAPVVERLIAAGAVPIGKTHLDQFATGLVGVRAPQGPCANAFDDRYIAGGSSSGSAVATALGQVGFALGTDTAGSGRIPAGFHNIIGLKPTRGTLSIQGVVPACRSLDCVSIFALSAGDAHLVRRQCVVRADAFSREFFDDEIAEDEYHRSRAEPDFVFAVPGDEFLRLDASYKEPWERAIALLEEMGGRKIIFDFAPFQEAAQLLYGGPWLAERYAAVGEFIEAHPNDVFPVTKEVILAGKTPTAVDAFRAMYRLEDLRRTALEILGGVDFAVVPTAPRIYTIAEVEADPHGPNAELGYYTNFMNLLDLCAVAAPAGFRDDGLPFGVTMFAPAGADGRLAGYAGRLHAASPGARLGATEVGLRPVQEIVVCGAHMSGMALNHQLTERGAKLVRKTTTAPAYRFFALPGGGVDRPGLIRDEKGAAGRLIEVEVWSMPSDRWGDFIAGIPAPLGIGSLQLADGSYVKGFICEGYAAELDGARDITDLGSWRKFMAGKS